MLTIKRCPKVNENKKAGGGGGDTWQWARLGGWLSNEWHGDMWHLGGTDMSVVDQLECDMW
jgi:hypothetical protein